MTDATTALQTAYDARVSRLGAVAASQEVAQATLLALIVFLAQTEAEMAARLDAPIYSRALRRFETLTEGVLLMARVVWSRVAAPLPTLRYLRAREDSA